MIRNFKSEDIDDIMQLWRDTNIETHNFIEHSYWQDNFEMVKKMIPQAAVYIYECDNRVQGFVGMQEDYIAGIFVRNEMQSKGIGKKLIDYVKESHGELCLQVYKKNNRAVSFYLREGFICLKEQIDENTGETEFVMQWRK